MKKLLHKSLIFTTIVITTPAYAAPDARTTVATVNTAAATPIEAPDTAASDNAASDASASNVKISNKGQEATAFSWTGFYVGVNGGYGWSGHPINESGSTTGGPTSLANAMRNGAIPSSLAGNPSGPLGGIQVGYNYQLDPLSVLGVVVDYDWANIGQSQTATPNIPGFPNYTTYSQQKIKSLASARALIGFVPTSYPLLAYLTVGWAYGQTQLDASISNPGCTFFCGSNSSSNDSTSGWVAGGGLAYNFLCHWTANAELLFYDLGKQQQQIVDPSFPNSSLSQNVMYKGNIIRAGISYKF